MEEALTTPAPAQNTDMVRAWLNRLPDMLEAVLFALVAVAVGLLLLRYGKKLIAFALSKRKTENAEETRSVKTVQSLLNSVFTYLMYFLMAVVVLRAFGVDVSGLLTVAGVGGVAVGFGAQTLVKDVISGAFLWSEKRIAVGDIVTVAGQTGTVVTVNLRTTVLRGTNGNLYTIPNGDIRLVVNMSRTYRCAQVDFTLLHGQDFNRALEVMDDEGHKLAQRLSLANPPDAIGIVACDVRGATIRVECRCEVDECWALEREIRLCMLTRLQSEGFKP